MAAERLSERVGTLHVPARRQAVRAVRARYDNAETTDENRRHWAGASGLSADALASPAVRTTLRNRCRYECRNNSWAKGIRDTLANDTIGTGPRLQMVTRARDLNALIEADFADWAVEVGLAEKLRAMRAARVEAGEMFGLMATNPGLAHPVKLDLSLAEAEQVCSPYALEREERLTDGIEFDPHGNPARYWVMRYHPGGIGYLKFSEDDFDPWPARFVLHYRRLDRPGQVRGVPELTPAIDQFAELRRYSKAVIAAAETAADFAAVIYSDAPPNATDAEDTAEVTAMDTVELARRMATTLPQGWKLGQVHAEQPTTTYRDFVNAKLGEIARCLGVPFHVAALDAAGANMSAAYVVGQKYERTIAVDRSELECLLDRLFDAWLGEWIRAVRPAGPLPERFTHVWQWDAIGNHADPIKVANAQAVQLANGVTSIPREYARQGLDWEDEQKAAAAALGLSLDEYRERLRNKLFGATGAAPTPAPAPGQPQREEDDEAADD